MSEKLLKIGELARRCGVPAATIKHYAREGLVTPAKIGRNIAWYEPATVERVQRIKALQRDGHMPLRIIKDALDGKDTLAGVVETLTEVLTKDEGGARTKRSLEEQGARASELAWLEAIGAVRPVEVDGEVGYAAADVELLRTLGAARRAGLSPEMLPLDIVGDYVSALQRLVEVELTLFRRGVVPRARGQLGPLTEVAARLSERLVVLLRRRLILPTLRAMGEVEAATASPRRAAGAGGPEAKARRSAAKPSAKPARSGRAKPSGRARRPLTRGLQSKK